LTVVVPAPAASGQLPFTGTNAVGYLLASIALVGLGSALVLTTRRRRRRRSV
jgi:LPXTG-motif cell wall-anchored protein